MRATLPICSARQPHTASAIAGSSAGVGLDSHARRTEGSCRDGKLSARLCTAARQAALLVRPLTLSTSALQARSRHGQAVSCLLAVIISAYLTDSASRAPRTVVDKSQASVRRQVVHCSVFVLPDSLTTTLSAAFEARGEAAAAGDEEEIGSSLRQPCLATTRAWIGDYLSCSHQLRSVSKRARHCSGSQGAYVAAIVTVVSVAASWPGTTTVAVADDGSRDER